MTHGEVFRAYMKAANSTSDTQDDRHLSEALMIAYCHGEMSALEHEAAEAHLVGCEPCIALFRSASDFLEPARADEAEITAGETNEAWQSLLERVQTASPTNAGGAGTTVVQGDFQRAPDKKFLLNSRVTLALAASLLISFGALGWLTWSYWKERQTRRQTQEIASQSAVRQRELEQQLAQLKQSGGDQGKLERNQRLAAEAERDRLKAELDSLQQTQQDIPVYSARLSSERGAEDDVRVPFTRGVKAARLRLLINKPYEFPEYAIELLDHRGRIVREISGLRPTGEDGALSFRLNRASLGAGKYRLRLLGGKTKKQLGEYGLSVTVDPR